MGDAEHLWNTTAGILHQQVSDVVWMSTFSNVTPVALDGECLTIEVPSAIVKDRIDRRYGELIRGALADAGVPGLDLSVEVTDLPPIGMPDAGDLDGELQLMAEEAIGGLSRTVEVRDIRTIPRPDTAAGSDSTPINPKYTFDAFVTGSSNRFAQAAALSVAETPARSYNPLFIYGAAGLGKTHLLQAIANYVRENYPHYTVRYVSTETFLNHFVDAVRNGTLQDFKRRYREIDVLLVDDIQFIERTEQFQEEFFHTFNTLHQASRQIVLSSDRPPDSMATLEDRLRSRFKMGLITDIQPPDFETRLAILRKKAEQDRANVPDAVLEFIVTHITNNIRELEGALIRVAAYANLYQQDLTVEIAEQVLSDILSDRQPRQITPEIILEATAKKYGFPIDELTGKSRRRPLVTARQVSMYVFRELTDLSYPQIARSFGGKDHTTVIYAYEKISTLMKERKTIYDDVTSLIQGLKNGG